MSRPCFILASIVCSSVVIGGCGFFDPEAAVRTRFDQFSAHVLKGETDACVDFIDPFKVKSTDANGVKLFVQLMQEGVEVLGLKEGDIRCDKIGVAADGKSASVQISVKKNGNWESRAPARWVNVDGQWYVTF